MARTLQEQIEDARWAVEQARTPEERHGAQLILQVLLMQSVDNPPKPRRRAA